MPTNKRFNDGQLSLVPTNPVAGSAIGAPGRTGFATWIALTALGGGGNIPTEQTVDLSGGVWALAVTDTVGGGVAVGDTLFYQNGAPGIIDNLASGFFFGFALATVGVGLTATINVLKIASPAAGALGAGTVGTNQLAVGALSANAAGRAIIAANYFNAATVLDKFAAGSFDTANLLDVLAANAITNAVLLQAITAGSFDGPFLLQALGVGSLTNANLLQAIPANAFDNPFLLQAIVNDGFLADANTRALFQDRIWTEAKLALASLTGTVVAVTADDNLVGGIPVVHRFSIADQATGDVDYVLTHTERIVDVTVVKTGAAGAGANSIQLQTGGGAAITDAIVINIADQAVARMGAVDDATWEIAAAGTLRVHVVRAAGNSECTVYVHAVRV